MWKKILIILITFVGTFSAGFALKNLGASTTYATEDLDIGNKVVVGTNAGVDIIWDIVAMNNDTYVLLSSDILKTTTRCTTRTSENVMGSSAHILYCDYKTTDEYQRIKNINDDLISIETSILSIQSNEAYTKYDQTYIFVPTLEDMKDGGRFGLTSAQRILSTNYTYNGRTCYGYFLHPDSKATFTDGHSDKKTGYAAITGVNGPDVSYTGTADGGTISAAWGGALDDDLPYARLRIATEIKKIISC